MTAVPQLPPDSPPLRAARGAFGALGAAAILYQLVIVFQQDHPEPVRFFSFFTIDGNLLLAAVLLTGALRPGASPRRDAIRGAAALYLLITGLVYFTLLQVPEANLGLTAPWVNVVLHMLLPLVAIADWILAPPSAPIAWRTALLWLVFPVVYFVWSMLRGNETGWYPYPFLDPGLHGGYSGVLANALIVLLMGVALLTVVRAAANARFRAAAA